MATNHEHLLKASKQTSIAAVVANMSFEVKDNGYFITEDGATHIDEALAASETAVADLATANASVKDLTTQLQAAKDAGTTATNALATANERIKELEKKPAGNTVIKFGEQPAASADTSNKPWLTAPWNQKGLRLAAEAAQAANK